MDAPVTHLLGGAPVACPARSTVRIATAGWAIPRAASGRFPSSGAGLQRYASCFDAVEINSTFYRSHRASTYARWAAMTPSQFRFAVKLPRTITHDARLMDALPLALAFRAEVAQLGDKLGPLLVQLPPSLAFEATVAETFFAGLRGFWPQAIVCEPRHESWFEGEADALLEAHQIGRVAADPPPHPAGTVPGGWKGIAYWRLHGSPRIYYSPYDEAALSVLSAQLLARTSDETWCVFDNTASGAAMANALSLRGMIC